MSHVPPERTQRDPLAPVAEDKRPWWRWLIDVALAFCLLLLAVAVLTWTNTPSQPKPRQADLEFVEFEPEPVEAPVDLPVDDALEDDQPEVVDEPELPSEPEPEPEPEPETPPEPVRDTPPPPEPKDVPPEPVVDAVPKDLPEGDPKPLEADERPLRVGLEEQSFAEGGDGPTFAVGDQARGGRPTTRSVDRDRTAVAGAAEGGTGTTEARAAERPTRRPSGRGTGGSNSRRAALARGVSKTVPYPKVARDRGVESTCTARIQIGSDGKVSDVGNVSCDETGFGFEAALEAHIRNNFRFEPELVDGEPQAVEIRWRHDFRIDQ